MQNTLPLHLSPKGFHHVRVCGKFDHDDLMDMTESSPLVYLTTWKNELAVNHTKAVDALSWELSNGTPYRSLLGDLVLPHYCVVMCQMYDLSMHRPFEQMKFHGVFVTDQILPLLVFFSFSYSYCMYDHTYNLSMRRWL